MSEDKTFWIFPDLAESFDKATQAMQKLVEAFKPKTEAEYWAWLRYNDPLRYIYEQHHLHRGRSGQQ